jgi:hypothetical protein
MGIFEISNQGRINPMDVSKIVAEIDAKIASLQQARAVLADLDESTVTSQPRRGRPKGSTNAAKTVAAKAVSTSKPAKRKRNLSPEGRKRIAEAMRRRWAERRKEVPKAAKKVAVKKEVVVKK